MVDHLSDAALLLKRGETTLGTLRPYNTDFPRTNCKFEPTQGFDEIKPLFEEELRLLDAEDFTAFEEAYEKIQALGLSLVPADGRQIIEDFLLHILGDEAWFRY
jgi:hypothetical protein